MLLVLGAGSAFAHEEGSGAHADWKHDKAALAMIQLLQDAEEGAACSPRHRKSVMRAVLDVAADEASNHCGLLCNALVHAAEFEYGKACSLLKE